MKLSDVFSKQMPTLTLFALLLGSFSWASAQEQITLHFDNSGAEAGITSHGTREFSFMGSNWSGGVVASAAIFPLYASGASSYEIDLDGGQVVFDDPIDSARFFYVHGFGFAPGTATAFNPANEPIAAVMSRQATSFGAPSNFVLLNPEDPIARIEFSGGVIDEFTMTTLPQSPPLPGRIPLGDIEIELEEVTGGLFAPVYLTHAADGSGRLFVVDQVGLIRVIENGELLPTPFLDLREKIVELNPAFDERGLLGLAFHPDYAGNGRFFVRYSKPREGSPDEACNSPDAFVIGCHTAVLAEYRVSTEDPNVADPNSEVILFEVDEPEFNHDAGQVTFGPDGFLYFSLGDGGGRDDGLSSPDLPHGPGGHGQNIETPLGALLRIDVDTEAPFGIPSDNPFLGQDGLDAIYAHGFRNPYRFSFDRGGSHELFLADVGQDLIEEIDVVTNGGNYGWVIREGTSCFDPSNPTSPKANCLSEGLIDPVAEYSHDDGLAVIGGFVYRGTRIPALHGKYVFGDFSTAFIAPKGRLFYLDADGDRSQIFEFRLGLDPRPLGRFLLGFGEDEEGDLYVLTSGSSGPLRMDGQVSRIIRLPETPTAFVRGDANTDGGADLSDAIFIFNHLFSGGDAPPCRKSADTNDDGKLDLSDGIFLLSFLFLAGDTPADPFPGCGNDSTEDDLSCDSFGPCE